MAQRRLTTKKALNPPRRLMLAATVMLALWPALLASQVVAAAGPALAVDATLDRHAISPDIYGMNFGDTALAQELHVPVNRYGGNAASRYNHVTNVQNL